MRSARLVAALSNFIEKKLAVELVASFLGLRQDFSTKTLGRSYPGQFVEIFVQCLQYISTGKYESAPSVDHYLKNKAEQTSLADGLRICASRIARSIYTLRNKRNIAHKNEVDPNTFDLAFVYQGAAWIMAELIRNAKGITMQEAGTLIELINTPVGTLVEDIDGTRLVHADVPIKSELLILLHSFYPEKVPMKKVSESLSRRNAGSVRNRLRDIHAKKLVHGDGKTGYRLTAAGHTAALEVIQDILGE